ncbi:hypothetical protein [Streptomyces hokutonensis]|uniref:Uncharacterized protein n=1 Tax=Streptomyces hokutonensis TaxID=1306990 RepID=A0ABW6MNF5_9ACTN
MSDTAIAVPKFSREVLGRLSEIEVQYVSVLLNQDAVGVRQRHLLASLHLVTEAHAEELAVLPTTPADWTRLAIYGDGNELEGFR